MQDGLLLSNRIIRYLDPSAGFRALGVGLGLGGWALGAFWKVCSP